MMTSRTLLVALGVLLLAQPVFAKTESGDRDLGTFGQWRAYATSKDNQTICYMATTQQFTKTKNLKRGVAHLMITHRPVEGSTDVVSYSAGYMFKPAMDITATIGKKNYSLFTQKDTAWTHDAHADHELTAAIRANTTLTIKGIPATKGASTITDTLSLIGADAAYHAISQACGLAGYNTPAPILAKKDAIKKDKVKKDSLKQEDTKKKSVTQEPIKKTNSQKDNPKKDTKNKTTTKAQTPKKQKASQAAAVKSTKTTAPKTPHTKTKQHKNAE